MNERLKGYYKIITKMSNTINIHNKTNIDHLTITGFMNDDEKAMHLYNLQKQVFEIEERVK